MMECIVAVVTQMTSLPPPIHLFPPIPFSLLTSLSSTPTKGVGIENMAFDRNTESLFAELSSAGPDTEIDIADMDEGADLLGKTLPPSL